MYQVCEGRLVLVLLSMSGNPSITVDLWGFANSDQLFCLFGLLMVLDMYEVGLQWMYVFVGSPELLGVLSGHCSWCLLVMSQIVVD